MAETPSIDNAPQEEDAGSEGLDPQFLAFLEEEAESVKSAVSEGILPMKAHARAIMWVDTLVKLHAVGLDQSLESKDANQSAVWSRDLSALELSLALLQNVPPLKQPENGEE
jgi:hypothetical protein